MTPVGTGGASPVQVCDVRSGCQQWKPVCFPKPWAYYTMTVLIFQQLFLEKYTVKSVR
nr:MAG TPA: hypothetical protein [Caudoviricetes sp.]